MKLESTDITYFVEHGGRHYRTTDGKNWECLYGQSWEQEYHSENALSKLFEELRRDIYAAKLGKEWIDVMMRLGKAYELWKKDYDLWEAACADLMSAYDRWLD